MGRLRVLLLGALIGWAGVHLFYALKLYVGF